MLKERFNKIKKILSQRQPDLTVLLEDVQKPHNLAAIARTCDAVGIDEVHAVTAIKGLRLSQMAAGGIRRWITLNKYSSIEAAFKNLKSQNMQLVVTHLSEDTVDYTTCPHTARSKTNNVTEYTPYC